MATGVVSKRGLVSQSLQDLRLKGEGDVELGKHDEDLSELKPATAPHSKQELIAGLSYCCASASMVLLNKYALSSFGFTATNCLLFFQCLTGVVCVLLCHMVGIVKLEKWDNRIMMLWLPCNFIFVGMIGSSFYALANLGVAMVTVLKNLANLLTIGGDYFMYNKRYNLGVWLSLALIVVSALCGAATDLAFSAKGYAWQLVNCVFTAAYSLYLRGVMDKVEALTKRSPGLDQFSMVLYNNTLSLPLIFCLVLYFNELPTLASQPALKNPYFVAAATVSGMIGFAISFASLWFLSTTTATTYSLVGSLNKIPVAIIGIVAFNAPTSMQNLGSILLGLLAGVAFVRAKQVAAQGK